MQRYLEHEAKKADSHILAFIWKENAMTTNRHANAAAQPVQVPTEKHAALKRLITPPMMAWPTLLIWTLSVCGVLGTDILALTGKIPLWAACILNVGFQYPLFGVIHDASHRSISAIRPLNDLMGKIGLQMLIPGASLAMFRWTHMLHHRFTGGEKDPDAYVHGAWWTLPIRWMSFDIGYLLFMMRSDDPMAKKHLGPTVLAVSANVGLLVAFVYLGYGMEAILLWLVPARMTMLLFGFVFFWLPHTLEGISAADNLTLATNMRLGHEWLLGPLCQFQNYHLLHHLYPSAPPYKHPAIWRLMEPELRKRDLAIQNGFAIQPVVQHGQMLG